MKASVKSQALRNLAVVAMVATPCVSAFATNGYFSHGYGMKAKGMGGASVAMTDNAFAGANNPAVAAWAGNRAEVGVDLFMPEREMARVGSAADVTVKSDSNQFLVPEFGYNRALSDKLGVGITVYGNGGMNTDYAGGQLGVTCGQAPGTMNVMCGGGRLGVDLQQLIIAPTIAYKIADGQSVGFSPLLVRQIFKADGLSAFGVANNGTDSSSGMGFRLGYLGKITDALSVGVSYSPRISMSKFSQYAGLFAESGGFDIPSNATLGLSFRATPDVTVAVDYQKISYSDARSVSNASSAIMSGIPLGAANGSGFGWSDVSVMKVGVQWQATTALTMRAGINVGDNPVKSNDVTFNILAPGVVTTHYTVGGTYAISPTSEITIAYTHVPSNSVSGPSLGALGQGGNETIKMNQQSIGLQYGWRW